MAAKPEPEIEWEGVIDGQKVHSAFGTRDILIIVSEETLKGPDIVPRREVKLKQEDWEELDRLDLPPEFVSWDDDASIMMARYGMDERYTVVGVERNVPNDELTSTYLLKRIEGLMRNTEKQGIIIHYIGPGKRNTGDWCFEDGFITFQDIADLYSRYFKGRVLTIDSDCSYSGSWVKNFAEFLDQNRIQPCGHSARENGMLIKVFTSCQPTEIPYRLLYSVSGNKNDNKGQHTIYPNRLEISDEQHTYGDDPTEIRCDGKTFEDPCTISPLLTWERRLAKGRISVVRGTDRGRPVWHYVLLEDNEEKIKEFKELTQGQNAGKNTLKLEQYGQVLKSGWGEDPSNDDKQWLVKNYDATMSS